MTKDTKTIVAVAGVGILAFVGFKMYKAAHPYSDGDSVYVEAKAVVPDDAVGAAAIQTLSQGGINVGPWLTGTVRVDNINLAGGSSRGVVILANQPFAVTFPEAAIRSKAA